MSAYEDGADAQTGAGLDWAGLLSAFDRMPDVIFVTDSDDRLCFVGGAVLALTGITPTELIGKPLLTLVKHSDHGALLDALQNARGSEDGGAQVIELAWRSADRGNAAMVEVALRGCWGRGAFCGCVGVARDLRSRGQYLDDRLTSERVSAIVELAVATAHKINNPLAILSMQLGVMEHTVQANEPISLEMLEQMRQVIVRISEVVKDLAAVADTSVRKSLRGRAMVDLGGWKELAESDDDM